MNADVLYVGTDRGVYVSLDRGATWQGLPAALPNVPVHDLVVHPRDRELVAGTHGRSIWVLDALPVQELRTCARRRSTSSRSRRCSTSAAGRAGARRGSTTRVRPGGEDPVLERRGRHGDAHRARRRRARAAAPGDGRRAGVSRLHLGPAARRGAGARGRGGTARPQRTTKDDEKKARRKRRRRRTRRRGRGRRRASWPRRPGPRPCAWSWPLYVTPGTYTVRVTVGEARRRPS